MSLAPSARGEAPSRPAPIWRATLALAGAELRLTARRGENLLAVAVIPAAVLAFFAATEILAIPAGRPVDFLLPGALAIGVVAAGLVNLGIATAYERHYGVLKRLGGSPLPRSGLVTAKLLAVGAVVALQAVLLVGIAVAGFGWQSGPDASVLLAATALSLGTAAFAALGLLLAGTLRAEATLALANGLFLAALLLGGIVVPVDHLPGPLEAVARGLPAHALTETLRIALGSAAGDPLPQLGLLAGWGIGAAALATRAFRWD